MVRPLSMGDQDDGSESRQVGRRGVRPNRLIVQGSALLPYRGAIYVPPLGRINGAQRDARWFRIDPETFRAELLDPGPEPPPPDCWYAVSCNYGLVGGYRGDRTIPARFFRVLVDGESESLSGPLQLRLESRERGDDGEEKPVALVEDVFDSGGEPVAKDAGTAKADNRVSFTAGDWRKRRLEYCTRIYRNAYMKVGKRDPAWDTAALALLDAVARREACRDLPHGWVVERPSPEQLRAFARTAREKGCNDPLVSSICVCAWSPRRGAWRLPRPPWKQLKSFGNGSTRRSMRPTWPARFSHSPETGRTNSQAPVRGPLGRSKRRGSTGY